MAEGPIGDFYASYPDGGALHRNSSGQPLLVIGCHDHNWGHIRFLQAGDTPGPDGRVGWWEKAWSPIKDLNAVARNAAKMAENPELKASYAALHQTQINSMEILTGMGLEEETTGWHIERDHHIRGFGLDAFRWIPLGWKHEFTMLSMVGYHTCIKHNRDEAGNIVPFFTGHMEHFS